MKKINKDLAILAFTAFYFSNFIMLCTAYINNLSDNIKNCCRFLTFLLTLVPLYYLGEKINNLNKKISSYNDQVNIHKEDKKDKSEEQQNIIRDIRDGCVLIIGSLGLWSLSNLISSYFLNTKYFDEKYISNSKNLSLLATKFFVITPLIIYTISYSDKFQKAFTNFITSKDAGENKTNLKNELNK